MVRVGAKAPMLSAKAVLSRVDHLRAALGSCRSAGTDHMRTKWEAALVEATRIAVAVPLARRDEGPSLWQQVRARWSGNTPADSLLRASLLVHGVHSALGTFGVDVQFGGAARAAGLLPDGDPFSPERTALLPHEPATAIPRNFAERVRVVRPANSAPGHYEYRVDCAGIHETLQFDIRRTGGSAGGGVDDDGAHVLNIANRWVSKRHATVTFNPHTRQLTVTDHDSTNGTFLPSERDASDEILRIVNSSFSRRLRDGVTGVTICVGNVTIPVVLEHLPPHATSLGAEPSPDECTEVLDVLPPRPAAPMLSAGALFDGVREHFSDPKIANRITPTKIYNGNDVLFTLAGPGLHGRLTVKMRCALEAKMLVHLQWVLNHIAPLHTNDSPVDGVRVEFVSRDTLGVLRDQLPLVLKSGIVAVQLSNTHTGALNREGIMGKLRPDMRGVTLVLTVLEDDPRCLAACVTKARGLSAESQIAPALRRLFPDHG